jgi:hypothetical protein
MSTLVKNTQIATGTVTASDGRSLISITSVCRPLPKPVRWLIHKCLRWLDVQLSVEVITKPCVPLARAWYRSEN